MEPLITGNNKLVIFKKEIAPILIDFKYKFPNNEETATSHFVKLRE